MLSACFLKLFTAIFKNILLAFNFLIKSLQNSLTPTNCPWVSEDESSLLTQINMKIMPDIGLRLKIDKRCFYSNQHFHGNKYTETTKSVNFT